MALQDRLNIDLGELKGYLRIEHDADDQLLTNMSNAAKEQVALYLNNDFVTTDSEGNSVEQPIPFSVFLACYKLIALWYENRIAGAESSTAGGITMRYTNQYSTHDIPQQFFDLLVMYRRLAGL